VKGLFYKPEFIMIRNFVLLTTRIFSYCHCSQFKKRFFYFWKKYM